VFDYRLHFVRIREDGTAMPRHCVSVILLMNCAL